METMKTIILAGGLGTRISEETKAKPKPMVLLDQYPILWHVMNIYAQQGFDDFLIATGYMSESISNWVDSLNSKWQIETLDTGLETQTGGRIKQCLNHLKNEAEVFVTYSDGLANVNLNNLLDFHRRESRLATVTAVRPPARFGVINSENGLVLNFGEKRQSDAGWINGGFFVLNQEVASRISGSTESFESGALVKLVGEKELSAYSHYDFWQPMDTLREKKYLPNIVKKKFTLG
jgi:glucose-1-phosphate cytidylyltransferase